MQNKKYVRGKRRVVISVSCSQRQKQLIDSILNQLDRGFKSKYVVNLILNAIAHNNTTLAQPEPNEAEWQISVNPDTKAFICTWCDRNLPPRSRSKWIINLIASQP